MEPHNQCRICINWKNLVFTVKIMPMAKNNPHETGPHTHSLMVDSIKITLFYPIQKGQKKAESFHSLLKIKTNIFSDLHAGTV